MINESRVNPTLLKKYLNFENLIKYIKPILTIMSSTNNSDNSEVTSKIKFLHETWSNCLLYLNKCKCKCNNCSICAGPCDLHFCPFAIEKFSKAVWLCEYYFKHQESRNSLSNFIKEIFDLGLGYELEELKEYITDPEIKKKLSTFENTFQSFQDTGPAHFYIMVDKDEDN